MKWYVYALPALGGLSLGSAVAYIDMLLSRSVFHKNDWASIMGVNVLRLTLDALTLTAVFFICRHWKFDLAVPMISTAIGLTVVGTLFLSRMTKKFCAEEEARKNGGE